MNRWENKKESNKTKEKAKKMVDNILVMIYNIITRM